MAFRSSDALLLVSHHGRARDVLRGADDRGGVSVMAQEALYLAVDFVAVADQFSVPIYREYCGMDDSRDWQATMVDLWTDADERGLLACSFVGKRFVYADRVYGIVCAAWASFHGAGVQGDKSRARVKGTCTA